MEPKLQYKSPQIWESDLMYCSFEFEPGTYGTAIKIQGIPEEVDIINLQLLCRRTKDDPTSYLIDAFHCRERPENPQLLSSYLTKWYSFVKELYQFSGPWMIDMNFNKPCGTMPQLIVTEMVKVEPIPVPFNELA